jgi:hypothetical protein
MRDALEENLPADVAAAAWELISGALAREPWRVGFTAHAAYVAYLCRGEFRR